MLGIRSVALCVVALWIYPLWVILGEYRLDLLLQSSTCDRLPFNRLIKRLWLRHTGVQRLWENNSLQDWSNVWFLCRALWCELLSKLLDVFKRPQNNLLTPALCFQHSIHLCVHIHHYMHKYKVSAFRFPELFRWCAFTAETWPPS